MFCGECVLPTSCSGTVLSAALFVSGFEKCPSVIAGFNQFCLSTILEGNLQQRSLSAIVCVSGFGRRLQRVSGVSNFDCQWFWGKSSATRAFSYFSATVLRNVLHQTCAFSNLFRDVCTVLLATCLCAVLRYAFNDCWLSAIFFVRGSLGTPASNSHFQQFVP